MKNILLLIHDDRGQNARVQAALDLGRALDGHLTCVSVTEPVVALAGDFYGASAQAVLVADASAAATENRERVEACLEGEDVPWTMTDMTGSITEALVINAALADLVVLNTGSSDRPASEVCTLAGAVLFDARKPVVAVPAGSRRFDPFG